MIPLEEEPAGIHKEYLEELARKGISAGVSIVKE
jgi:hypothetical protein